jgi:1,2-diacylglycerol 3-alpha-glucosyltransferase
MAKKLNVGFFTDTFTPQINGVVTSIQNFQKELERQGHKVYIFAPAPELPDDKIDVFRFSSVKFIFQPEMRFAVPYSWQIDKRINSLNLDLVHAHTPFSLGFFAKYVSKDRQIPFVQTFHTLYPEYLHYILGLVGKTLIVQYGAKGMIKFLYNRSNFIIAPSLKIKEYLEKCGVKKPIEIISTGIDLKKFKNIDKKIFKQQYKINPQDKILLSIGRLGQEKNLDFLLYALSKIKNNKIKLLIIGDGPEKANLIKLAKKLNVNKKIIFLGYINREKIPFALAASNVFVFTSKTETQGLVLLEAAASSKPIVAIRDAAIEKFVKNGVNGFISDLKPEIFAQKIEKILDDKNIYKKFFVNSKKIAQNFSIEKQSKKLIKVYNKLLDRTP